MEVSKLKFVINETGKLSEEESKVVNDAYRVLFSEIYGYDILGEYLQEKDKYRGQTIYKDTYINSIDVANSISYMQGMLLLMIYDDADKLLGAGRVRRVEKISSKNPIVELFNQLLEKWLKEKDEKCVSVPDIAISSDCEDREAIWFETVKFLEGYFSSLGYDRMYLEIPCNSSILNNIDSIGYVEDVRDVPYTNKQKTRVVNKQLERLMDEQLNSSRK